MFANTVNILVVALVAFNAASVVAVPEPVITGAPVEKRENGLEERQCELDACFCLPLLGRHGKGTLEDPSEACLQDESAPYPNPASHPLFRSITDFCLSPVLSDLTSVIGGASSVFGDVTSFGGSIFTDATCK